MHLQSVAFILSEKSWQCLKVVQVKATTNVISFFFNVILVLDQET